MLLAQARRALCMDGIPEACNAAGERSGQRRPAEAPRKHGTREQDVFADRILAEASEFRQGASQVDDESIVAAGRVSVGPPEGAWAEKTSSI